MAQNPEVTITMEDGGVMKLELYPEIAPISVNNFLSLAGKGFYDGLTFHRVIPDFMIQGGDPRGDGTGGPGYAFFNESDESLNFNQPGMLAMANSGKNTNGSQFFITIVPTTWLNGGYTIFGKVVDEESQKVVNSIVVNDKMNKITIVRKGAEAEAFTATQADWDREFEKVVAAKVAEVEATFPGFTVDSATGIYKTTKAGSGAKCGTGKSVSTHYRGYLVDGTEFDSSAGREPLSFVTGKGDMIKGFDLMVQDMQLGEKRTVVLPADYGYGSRGYPGVIPGNEYIAFDIELVEIK